MLNKVAELENVGPAFTDDDTTLRALVDKVEELVREHNTLVDRVEAMMGLVYGR